MLTAQESTKTVTLFYCYVDEDYPFQEQLRAHFYLLRKLPFISDWGHGDVEAGQEREKEIDIHVECADIILLLVSVDFLNSDYYTTTIDRVLKRHQRNEAKVFLILLRSVDIPDDQFPGIERLPVGNEPIIRWEDREEAYTQIAVKMKKEVYTILGWNPVSGPSSERAHSGQGSQDSCPYLGLKPYTEQDAHFFFGRRTYTLDLMQKLREDKRLLLVLGPTGSGKTSVIQAGVIPLLREGKTISRSSSWEIVTFTPAEHPISQLLSLLEVPDADDVDQAIKVWMQHHPKNERIVIIIDPFEELFKQASLQEQRDFIKQCLKLILYDLATIIIGMNDAYYGDLAQFDDFIELAEPQISNIPALKKEEIRDIIQKPAESVRLQFEGYLVEKIVDDTMTSTKEPERRYRHSSVLPLLSICLEELYKKQHDHYVTLDDYAALGEVSGSLTVFAAKAFNDFNEQQQALARRIFVDLVALGDESEGRPDSRRKRLLANLYTIDEEQKEVQEVVDKLAEAHLLELQRDEQKKDTEVTLIHESLVYEWALLRSWLRKDRLFILWYQDFEHQLQKWLKSSILPHQRDTTYLLRGTMLLEAKEWMKEHSQRFRGEEAQNFVLASSELQEQEENQEKSLQQMQIRQQIMLAKQVATKVLLLQEQEPRSLRKSLLLGVEALRRHHGVEADQVVRHALAMLPRFLSRINMGTSRTLLFSDDGCNLATAGSNGVSWISHLQSDEEFSDTLLLGETRAIAFSAHGEYLLAGTYEGVAWFIETQASRRAALMKYHAHIHGVALTRKEPYIAAIGYDDGMIRVCQFLEGDKSGMSFSEAVLEQHAIVQYACSHGSAIATLSFSQNEHYLVSGGTDHVVRVWSKDDGLCLDMHDFNRPIRSVLWSPDDTSIAVVSENGTGFVWHWEQRSRKVWQRKKDRVVKIPQRGKIQSLTFSPDGKCIATASTDGLARIWSLEDMTEVKSFPHTRSVSALAYHQSEDWFVTASEDGNVRVYGISDSIVRQCLPHDTPVRAIALSPQKPYLATVDDHECLWVWQINDGTLPVRFHYSGKVVHLAFDQKSDKNLLHFAVKEAGRINIGTLSLDPSFINTIYEFQHAPSWIVSNSKGRLTIADDTNNIRIFSFDGRYSAEATSDGGVHVIALKGNHHKNTNYVSGTIVALVFSHDGEYLAIATAEGTLFFWKWREKGLVPMPLPQDLSIQAATFSRDDECLVVVANRNEVFLWYWKTQTEKLKAAFRQDSNINTLSLCPNTQYLLTTSRDEKVRVWDRTTGSEIWNLSHKGEVVSATFDNEGTYIATASSDHTVGIWDVSTGEQLASLKHDDKVYAVAFSKNGRDLATVCDDSIIRIWAWRQDDLETAAKVRLIANLTPEEWQEYLGNEPYKETFTDLGWRDLS